MLIDSHAHLLYADTHAGGTVADTLESAAQAGVGGILNICCKPDTEWDGAQDLIATYPNIWTSYGLHPHESDIGITKDAILNAAKLSKVVGVGECGLDYFYDRSPREQQRKMFELQIETAIETDLPIIIHTRDAEADTMDILKVAGPKLRGLLHCFTGTQKLADFALGIGFYLSFSGIVTFPKATDLHAVAASTPLDRILVETDSPYLAPVPFRGKSNQPAYVAEVARKIAILKNMPYETVCDATVANFYRLFNKVTPL